MNTHPNDSRFARAINLLEFERLKLKEYIRVLNRNSDEVMHNFSTEEQEREVSQIEEALAVLRRNE